MQWVPEHQADVAVLEEPEHLTWYHHGSRWTDKFRHVVGIMHTNYLDYARREENGALKAFMLRMVNSWVCRVHCHKVVKLSDAVQDLPRQCTQFVHGVSPKFLEVGAAKARAAKEAAEAAAAAVCAPAYPLASLVNPAPAGGLERAGGERDTSSQVWPQGAYFLGKVVWAKGYTELLDLMEKHVAKGNPPVLMDIYGSGGDKQVKTHFCHVLHLNHFFRILL
jgi:digalactosyldiacylglycerol synthase